MDLIIDGLTDLFSIFFNILRIPIAIGLVWWVILLIHRHITKDQRDFDYEKHCIEGLYNELNDLLASIGNEMYALGSLLRSIDSSLLRAWIELDRGAASLFWQEIEQASRDLRDVASKQRRISGINKEYLDKADKLYEKYKLGHPGVPYSSAIRGSIELEKNLCRRLSELAYKAHAIYSFAHIFETRRTNSILLAGFHSLSQAIDSMNQSINDSLHDFTHSFDKLHETYLKIEDSATRDRYKVDEHLKRLNASAIESRNKLGDALTVIRGITQR